MAYEESHSNGFTSYLSNREQYVSIENTLSTMQKLSVEFHREVP